MNEQDAADTLNAAADHIRMQGLHNSGGWGAIYMDDGPCCILGTIQMVRPDLAYKIWEDAIDAIAKVLSTENREIAPWNDTPGRTAEEVITVLMEAAARLRESPRR